MSKLTLNPRILGQAENAHRALLEGILAGTGLSYQRWVALTIAAANGKAAESDIVDRLVYALKIDERAARTVIAEMTAASMLTAGGTHLHLTDAGQNLYGKIRAAVDETIADLYKGIPGGDLEIAGRVLTELTRRVNAKLAKGPSTDETRSQH